jgi:hypothetical protein
MQVMRNPYPLPHIQDIFHNLEGFEYATAIDINMGYYHVPLDEDSQRICTTALPWGKYAYQRLPMDLHVRRIFSNIGWINCLEIYRIVLSTWTIYWY